jgi:hypothetical protein
MTKKHYLLGGALALSLASSASALLIASEDFNYALANGTSISGLNGGTGWDEVYPAPSATAALQNGLSFPGIVSSGQAMEMQVNANLSTNGRNWDTAVANGTYWYSLLVNPTTSLAPATPAARGTFGLFQNSADNQNGFGFRIDNNAGSPQFKAWTRTQAAGANIDFLGGYNQTYLVLGRVIVGAVNTTSDLWVFDTSDVLPTSVAAAGTVQSSQTQTTGTLNAAMYARLFSNSAPISFDEIKLGTTFEDVMPIPEPSTYAALAALASLGFVLARKRKS